MSALSQFSGGTGPISSLPCGFSGAQAALPATGPILSTASGAVTATVYKTILSQTGRGRLNMLFLRSANTTSKTMSIRLTIDGRQLPVNTTPTTATTSSYVLVGQIVGGTTTSALAQPIDFQSQCLIEYTSSVTETDGCNLYYNHEVWA